MGRKLVQVTAVMAIALASIIGATAANAATSAGQHCPSGGTKYAASGSQTVGGVTITWGNTSVAITGGTASFCVKGGISGNSGTVTRVPGTYTTASLGLVGPNGQSQAISYLVLYSTEHRDFTFDADASSDCRLIDGHVIVKVDFTNLSPDSMTITVTEITFTNQSSTVTVPAGQMVHLEFDVGLSPKPTGQVKIDIGWTDNFPGVTSVTVNHSQTPACGPAAV